MIDDPLAKIPHPRNEKLMKSLFSLLRYSLPTTNKGLLLIRNHRSENIIPLLHRLKHKGRVMRTVLLEAAGLLFFGLHDVVLVFVGDR